MLRDAAQTEEHVYIFRVGAKVFEEVVSWARTEYPDVTVTWEVCEGSVLARLRQEQPAEGLPSAADAIARMVWQCEESDSDDDKSCGFEPPEPSIQRLRRPDNWA